MKKIRKIEQCFDKDGNFVVLTPGKPFDPFRTSDEYFDMYCLLFDDDGDVLSDAESTVIDLINKNSWGPFCSATTLVYAASVSHFTKGNYTSNYMWR